MFYSSLATKDCSVMDAYGSRLVDSRYSYAFMSGTACHIASASGTDAVETMKKHHKRGNARHHQTGPHISNKVSPKGVATDPVLHFSIVCCPSGNHTEGELCIDSANKTSGLVQSTTFSLQSLLVLTVLRKIGNQTVFVHPPTTAEFSGHNDKLYAGENSQSLSYHNQVCSEVCSLAYGETAGKQLPEALRFDYATDAEVQSQSMEPTPGLTRISHAAKGPVSEDDEHTKDLLQQVCRPEAQKSLQTEQQPEETSSIWSESNGLSDVPACNAHSCISQIVLAANPLGNTLEEHNTQREEMYHGFTQSTDISECKADEAEISKGEDRGQKGDVYTGASNSLDALFESSSAVCNSSVLHEGKVAFRADEMNTIEVAGGSEDIEEMDDENTSHAHFGEEETNCPKSAQKYKEISVLKFMPVTLDLASQAHARGHSEKFCGVPFPPNKSSKEKLQDCLQEDDVHSEVLALFYGGLFTGSHLTRFKMFMQHGEMCFPRYTDEQARLETLKRCNERQLRGYQTEELARVGWFFNGRALVTFCCGMEMPQTPRGEPLDVHCGLSPRCFFAVSVQSSAAVAYDGEMQKVAERVQSLEVAGASAPLGVGIQASDDPFGAYGVASDVFEDGQHDMFVGYQETLPGEHWEGGLDYAINFSTPVEDSYYREGLVTNRTPTAAEVWHPFSGVSEEPDANARPASFQQNSVTNAGRVYVRAPAAPSSQGTARLLRALENDPGRRSPPNPINYEEQMEIFIGPLGDHDRPRHPQFAFPSVRIWTFEGWPRDHPLKPPVLADAGLFYAGYGDCVLCYSCGIGLRHWSPMDNAWIEHARWRPTCFYVRNVQGAEFIQVAQELTRNNRHPTYEDVRLEANRRQRANEQATGDQEAAPALPGQGDGELNLLCKVCYTREMCIVLMPCRHLAVCEHCSGRVFACPICRSRVESSFRASFG